MRERTKHIRTIIKRNAKRVSLSVTVVVFIMLSPLWGAGGLMAQTPPPGGSPTEGAPLDGFTTLLLAGGAAYGIQKMRKKRAE